MHNKIRSNENKNTMKAECKNVRRQTNDTMNVQNDEDINA